MALFILLVIILQIVVWIVKAVPAFFRADGPENSLEIYPIDGPVQQQSSSINVEPIGRVNQSVNQYEEKKVKCARETQTDPDPEKVQCEKRDREYEYQESSVITIEHRMERSVSFILDDQTPP